MTIETNENKSIVIEQVEVGLFQKNIKSSSGTRIYFRHVAPFKKLSNRVHKWEMILLSRLSLSPSLLSFSLSLLFVRIFLFTPVGPPGSFVAETYCTGREYLSEWYAVWNNNSITDRLFQSKETGGISLHSRRRNARREPCTAACTWGRFIRCRFSSMEIRQRIPSPFLYNVPTVKNYYPLLLFPLYLSYAPHYHHTVVQTVRTFAGFTPTAWRKNVEIVPA